MYVFQEHNTVCRNFVFTPDVPVRLDYVGKHIDVEHRLQGLVIGLAQLNRAELRLKSLNLRQGYDYCTVYFSHES